MKKLRSLPQNRDFFDVYATLIKTVRKSKTAVQMVSAATEIGIIYSAALSALQPIFPTGATYLAMGIAILGTLVIEMGLRVMMPQSVDAILYKRFQGLHLPMTITVISLSVALVATSGTLSFKNSKVVVEQFTPEVKETATYLPDSIYLVKADLLQREYAADSLATAQKYTGLQEATTLAFANRIKAKERELENLRRKEVRTELSFATRKDQTRLAIENLKAEQAEALVNLKTEEEQVFTTLRTDYKTALTGIQNDHQQSIQDIQATNQSAQREREYLVQSYGLGLGWFTLVCLFIFCLAVVLDRVHAKGAGIAEKIDISQYDFSPSIWVNALEAIRERVNYFFHNKIRAIEEATPPAPLPAARQELYDPTALTNVTITLKLESEKESGEQVIYIPNKRRQIGFQRVPPTEEESAHTKDSCVIKDAPKDIDLRQCKIRLKDYKKRLGKHIQKKIKQEGKGEVVSKRTLNAIENNQRWVEHYTQLLQKLSGEIKNK
jgi:hypothetical protein